MNADAYSGRFDRLFERISNWVKGGPLATTFAKPSASETASMPPHADFVLDTA
jgi:hypothetical protein